MLFPEVNLSKVCFETELIDTVQKFPYIAK